MSAFTHGFQHGFFHGMFDRMFGGWNMFSCWNQAPMFFTPSYMQGGFFQYQTPVMSMPSLWNINVPDFTSIQPNWGTVQSSVNYTMPDFSSSFSWGDTFVKSTHSNVKTKKYSDNDTSAVSYDAKELMDKWKKKQPQLTQGFYNKVVEISKRVQCDPNDLMALMNIESAGTFSPSVTNGIGAVGLIQFVPKYVSSYGTSIEALKKMTAEEQLTYVEKYLTINKKNAGISGRLDAGTLYALVFLPGYAKQEVLTSKGQNFYESNPLLDYNKDEKITKSDLAAHIRDNRA